MNKLFNVVIEHSAIVNMDLYDVCEKLQVVVGGYCSGSSGAVFGIA
jgi:hypothetical protein